MKTTKLLFTAVLLVFCGLASISVNAKADITIAKNGKSTFAIVIPAKAPDSVNAAAKELQRDIEESTKAKLSIKKDNEKVSGSFISLGGTTKAQSANISAKDIADSGFRIVTKGNNLYIIGFDTVAKIDYTRNHWGEMTPQPDIPGPQYTEDGGWSNGTANGVYTFLEDYLGVRWLMPGKLGRDVPKKSTFTVSDMDRTEEPEFNYRYLSGLETNARHLPLVDQWIDHQKLGSSFQLDYNHNWWHTINGGFGGARRTAHTDTEAVKRAYKEHPGWFAMHKNGKRPYPEDYHAKLETTNEGLVNFFADQAVKYLKANPNANAYSISPSDGNSQPWSYSPESRALFDPSPYEQLKDKFRDTKLDKRPSTTPLILKFYHDVAQAVAKKDPQGRVAGYLYSNYRYPPVKGNMKLPDNFIPVMVPSQNSYTLYRKNERRQFDYVMDSWSKVIPSIWFYYGYPNQVLSRNAAGMMTPPGNSILNFLFPRLLKYHIKGTMFYGNTSWSSSSMTNYIDAKMIWDPTLNANDLQQEWLTRAYGTKAGNAMERFYQKLDGWFDQYSNKYMAKSATLSNPRERAYRDLYAPHYEEMEKLFLEAEKQPMTDIQKQRFDLLKQNMIVLRWRLVNAGYIKADKESPLKRNGKEVSNLLFDDSERGRIRQAKDGAFDIFPVLWYGDQGHRTRVKVSLGKAPKGASTDKMPNSGFVSLYAAEKGKITVKIKNVKAGSAFVGYHVYGPEGENDFRVIQQGLLYAGNEITFNAAKGAMYLLRITSHEITLPKLDYTISIPNASFASGSFEDGTLYLKGKEAPVYVYVAKGLDLSQVGNGNTVTLTTQSSQDAARMAELNKYESSKVLLKLDEKWHFKTDPEKIGLKDGDAANDYKDNSWKLIKATDNWQNQGFDNYLGTAWYRKTFKTAQAPQGKVLLFFGAVDGDAIVYVNGKKVGEHLLGNGGKGWDEPFSLDVTGVVKKGQNTIAVQVTKKSNVSGIYKGVALLELAK